MSRIDQTSLRHEKQSGFAKTREASESCPNNANLHTTFGTCKIDFHSILPAILKKVRRMPTG